MDPLLNELIKGAFTLSAVALGSVIALNVYFRQKEYELTKQRYLEEGVDVVAAELDLAFGVVSHNYARSLDLCKLFRDSKQHFQETELGKGFLPLDGSKFHQIAHYRVSSLIGTEVVWETYQTAMAYAYSANSVIAHEIPEAIRILSQQKEPEFDRQAVVQKMFAKLREVHDGGFKYSLLGREVHTLGLLLEAERLNLKAIASFRDRTQVKELIVRLKTAFETENHSNGDGMDDPSMK